jgi:hypothetical protein
VVLSSAKCPAPETRPTDLLVGQEPERRSLLGHADIARQLHLGIATVKTHVGSLLAKTSTDNRVRSALLAHEVDLR